MAEPAGELAEGAALEPELQDTLDNTGFVLKSELGDANFEISLFKEKGRAPAKDHRSHRQAQAQEHEPSQGFNESRSLKE